MLKADTLCTLLLGSRFGLVHCQQCVSLAIFQSAKVVMTLAMDGKAGEMCTSVGAGGCCGAGGSRGSGIGRL